MFDTKSIYLQSTRGIWRNPLISTLVVRYLRFFMREKEINTFLNKHIELSAREFIGEVFSYLNVDYQMSLAVAAELPAFGRAMVVANHPLGGLDGLMLLHAMLSIRDDVNIVANQNLMKVVPLAPHIIPVNNWKNEYSRRSITKIREALQNDEMVIFFPAGEVSRKLEGKIQDGKWIKTCFSLAKACDVPILPIYIGGQNSRAFYAISKIAPNLSTAMLVREMWNQKRRSIVLNIGKALPMQMLNKLPLTDKEITQLIRQHVYQLTSGEQGVFTERQTIAEPLNENLMLNAIKNGTTLLGNIGEEHQALLYEVKKNAVLLQEIGRLREVTFRQVGEGSGLPRDLDQYDAYYFHLLVWYEKNKEILGAYRVYPSAPVLKNRSIKALYTENMFEYGGDLSWLGIGMELGRGFVVPEYWNSRALDMMWQGIGAFYARYPDIRYLFGSVSISQHYPKEVVDGIVSLYRFYMSTEDFHVKAKNPYRISLSAQRRWKDFFSGMDFAQAEKALKKHLQLMGFTIPTLFKHYSALCTEGGVQFTDFGVDPEFGFTVDGFVIVDMEKMKPKKYARYIAPYTGERSAI